MSTKRTQQTEHGQKSEKKSWNLITILRRSRVIITMQLMCESMHTAKPEPYSMYTPTLPEETPQSPPTPHLPFALDTLVRVGGWRGVEAGGERRYIKHN